MNNLFSREKNLKWYYIVIYLLVLTVPFNHKEKFSIYDPDLIWSKYILSFLAVTGLYFIARDFKKYIRDPFFIFLSGFVLFQVISLIQTGDYISSLRLIGFQASVALAYIPIRNFLYERKDALKDLVFVYALGFIPVFVFLIIQIFMHIKYGVAVGGIWPVSGYPTRYGATFWDINHFGAFCSALSLILIGFTSNKNISTKMRVFNVLVLAGLFISLYLTRSRSSMVGFMAGIIVYVVLYIRSLKTHITDSMKSVVYYALTLGSVSGSLFLLFKFADPIRAALLYRAISFFAHLFLLKVGIILGFQNFLLGIGANSFHAYFRHTVWADAYFYIDRAALDLKLPLHNLWLEVFAETGLISLIFFMAFWLVLLMGLYRSYSKTGGKLALGFVAGLTSFLVGGFMYSYKSEFFWLFVIIASAYVSKLYFMDAKAKTLTIINKIVCPANCDYLKAGLAVLSLITLAFPILYLVHPLNNHEINLFYGGFESNFIVDLYTKILMMFRYVIGNYTYTGRLVSLLFYIGSIVFLYLILNRYVKSFYAFIIAAIILGIANIIEPNLLVSIKWFISFALLGIAALLILILTFINKRVEAFDIDNKKLNIGLTLLFAAIIGGGVFANNNYFKKSYSADLTFLIELAYNRGFLTQSLVQVGDSIELNGIYYFTDNVVKRGNDFYILEGVAVPITGFDMLDYKHNVFVFSTNDTNLSKAKEYLELLKSKSLFRFTELSQGDYKIVMVENLPVESTSK